MLRKISEQYWFGPLIGLVAGMVITHHVIGSAIFAFLGLLIQGGLITSRKNSPEKTAGFLGTEADYLQSIIALAAIVVKADKNISDQQLNFIESKLLRDYSPKHVHRLMSLLKIELQRENNLDRHTRIVAEEFLDASKIQLMHFLVRVSLADGLLANAELKCLKEIAVKIELSLRTFDAILAMFKFKREFEQEKEFPKKKSSSQLLEAAYKILEIEKSVTDGQVKKAYRKMAVQHHPDKVVHLGEAFQKLANEKFQIIVAAYELIQKERKFA